MKVIVTKIGSVEGRNWAVVVPVTSEGISGQVIANVRNAKDGTGASVPVGVIDAVALGMRAAHTSDEGKADGDSYTLYV